MRNPPIEHSFKKGTSGNPAGRPKKLNTEILEKSLQTYLLAMKKDEHSKAKIARVEKILNEKS